MGYRPYFRFNIFIDITKLVEARHTSVCIMESYDFIYMFWIVFK